MYDPSMLQGTCVEVPLPADGVLTSIKMLDCNGRDQVAVRIGSQGWDSFEKPMPDILRRLLAGSGGVVLDVGANTGFYAMLAASIRSDLQVWAVEPDPKVLPVLGKNIEMNGLSDRVKVIPVALSDRSGTARLYVPTQEHGLVETSSSLERTFRVEHSEVVDTEVTTLDVITGGLRNLFLKVPLIKIDVEGHEAPVFRGAMKTIRKHRPFIFVEILDRSEFNFFDRFLQDQSYVDFTLQTDSTAKENDRVDFDPLAWNHVLVPQEKRLQFLAATGGISPPER